MVLLPTNLKNINKRIKTVKSRYKIYMTNIRVWQVIINCGLLLKSVIITLFDYWPKI